MLAKEIQDDGTFADAVGYAADGGIAHVTDSEDAGDIGFEKTRGALERPHGADYFRAEGSSLYGGLAGGAGSSNHKDFLILTECCGRQQSRWLSGESTARMR